MKSMLELSAHLPQVEFGAGQAIVREGEAGGSVWVLVSGSLQVRKGSVPINTINRPGALVGEMSLLLDRPYSATVEAIGPCVMRHAADGRALLASDPAVTALLATGLAERLHFVTTYLADLKFQYGDTPGLAMIPDVLRQLAQRQAPPARPGSLRDPDPEY